MGRQWGCDWYEPLVGVQHHYGHARRSLRPAPCARHLSVAQCAVKLTRSAASRVSTAPRHRALPQLRRPLLLRRHQARSDGMKDKTRGIAYIQLLHQLSAVAIDSLDADG